MWELFQNWSAFAGTGLAVKSIEEYEYWIVKFLAKTKADPREVMLSDLTAFLSSLGAHGPAKGMAKRALRHFFGWMRAAGERADDPSEMLPKMRRHQSVPHWLTEEEIQQLADAARKRHPEWASCILFLWGTGARVGEACAVPPADIDLTEQYVVFRKTKTGVERLVHLGPTARRAAQELLQRSTPPRLPTLLGVSPNAIRERMKVAGRMAGLPIEKIHPHALRHSAATALLRRGADVAEVQAFLGHADVRMTMFYQHVASPRAKQTAELL
jgi:site-specific recombinase XerD